MDYEYGNDFNNNDQSINGDKFTEIPYFIEEQKEEEQKKEGNFYCIISAICMGVSLLSVSLTTMISEGAVIFTGMLNIISTVAAYVLMIYVRVRYPKNIFGKVLMCLYIILAIITVLIIVFVIVLFYIFYKMLEATCSGLG